jgi:hypothetical protein
VAERIAEVVALDAACATLRAGAACSGCDGCGGRCNVFRDWRAEGGEIAVPLEQFPDAPHLGQSWTVSLDDDALLRQAARGYGLALLGLLSGAALGFGLARLADIAPDPPTLLGALSGTLAGWRRSKRSPLLSCNLRVTGAFDP